MSWLEKASLMIEEETKKAQALETSFQVPENSDPEKAGEVAEKSLNESEKNETDNSETNTNKTEMENKENGLQDNKEE